MSKKSDPAAQAAQADLVERPTVAAMLCDSPAHGLKHGQIVKASADLIDQLVRSGEADPHKDAVASAHAAGGQIVEITAAA